MDKRPTQVLELARKLTDSEIVRLSKQQQDAMRDKASIELNLKSEVKRIKSLIDAKDEEITILGARIDSATESEKILCYVVKDREQRMTIFVSVDSGKIIKKEPFTAFELQRQLSISEVSFIEESTTTTEQTATTLFHQFVCIDVESIKSNADALSDYFTRMNEIESDLKYKYCVLVIDKMIKENLFDTDEQIFEFDTYYDIIEPMWAKYLSNLDINCFFVNAEEQALDGVIPDAAQENLEVPPPLPNESEIKSSLSEEFPKIDDKKPANKKGKDDNKDKGE